MELVTLLNGYSPFGKELAFNDKFISSALTYVEQTLINAEIVKLMPRISTSSVGS
ncbi:predicted protein [Sclerotinia sclerotiorum 1980 UF-70]|uniref:Uncharacterized protein n=1 Tax=Sclerotinia sclerotiorum (strain ATCC 18683 / 1980 / Ss-1) TaxID=665079 RepID=A7F3G2_SCLS1|nr:predicted protein [Sclerotinia sclerotiorum 1980 UF-70]EDN97283.1 predicted protein [Sclerotinia sclerotiorum 1980 UF-70]